MKQIQKSGEDYLEAVYNLLIHADHAHSVDVAKALGVTKPSACKALQNLAEQGYIKKESYGSVTLTENGLKAAQAVHGKHKAIRAFLTDILKVSEETAENDACKIEHCISEETAEKLFEFLKRN